MSTEQMPPLPPYFYGAEAGDGNKCWAERDLIEYARAYASQEVVRVMVALDVDRRTLFDAIRSLGYTTNSQTGEICDVVIKAIRVRGAA